MNGEVRLERDGPVATITLDRPAARHALTPCMLCALADSFIALRDDDTLRVAILTASGEAAFCAGGDLARTLPLLTGARAPEDAYDRRLLDDPVVLQAASLRDFPLHKPVVAAINGVCLAAGFELMLGTDIRVAAAHARFGLPEVQRALVPFAGSMARLPRQVPQAIALELLLTGQPIDAAAALQWGLVNHVLPADAVLDKARAIAQRIAGNGPLAVGAAKQAVLQASGLPLRQAYAIEDRHWARVRASADAREGPRAFTEKRSPRYTGH